MGAVACGLRWLVAVCLLVEAAACWAGLPDGYPRDYGAVMAAARQEGKVVVYSTTDLSVMAAVIRDFEQCFPGVKVEYHDLNSEELYYRFVSETAAQLPSADVLWSSAMDLQMKLANDDYAARYVSPELGALPRWAVWRSTAYGTTFEPVVIVYNKRHLTEADVPHTHSEFARLLTVRADVFHGNVTTYSIERSALGRMLATQDSRVQPGFWDLVRSMGHSGVKLESSTSEMVQRIASGRYFIGYNLIGSYAMSRARNDPAIGVVLPTDYTLVMSRIAILSRRAAHPNAGKLWLDYLLSRRGQGVMASKSELFPVRADVPGEFGAASLRARYGDRLKPIEVAVPLVVFLDRAKKREFLKRWERETATLNP
ncbi:MAG: ABC transporter substrate-binding protein [Proteobacteria bacterium]|nr:ABC transporter substrate-binding protein [Pseudomonadota bacterium]